MPFDGPVRMRNPDHIFDCVLHYIKETATIKHIYLGTFIAEGQRNTNDRFNLKKRHYIGPTSTCAELASLMSNQVLTQSGSLIWDCFVGTGSLLVAATSHGGTCFGSDIDFRVLKGLKKGKQVGSIRGNFDQYHLRQPELLRMDISVMTLRCRSMHDLVLVIIYRFDGIICDPPYGIRAGARKTKRTSDNVNIRNANTEVYDPDDVIVDLLDIAASSLRVGGRISYLLPTLGK